MTRTGLVLGIETSCDETAAAVVERGRHIRSNIIASQVSVHQRYGGVVPEIASRKHIEWIMPVIDAALKEAGVQLRQLAAIAATKGPGLVGGLLVGLSAAKALAFAADLPFIGVNHIEGHIYANVLANPHLEPPVVCLTVSGGHTDLLYIPKFGEYEKIGGTRDDAAGEAFDKIARVLGLPYPGGPQISALAETGCQESIAFPRGLAEPGNYDFSFSGLKTAAVNYIHGCRQRGEEFSLPDFAASFQWAIIDSLTKKTLAAANEWNVKTILLSGGVGANRTFRSHLQKEASVLEFDVFFPPPELCTDNAAMISSAGYFRCAAGHRDTLDLNAQATLPLGGQVKGGRP